MIDSDEQPLSILKCVACKTLYGPLMAACTRCGGPLTPAPGPLVTRSIPAGTYQPGEPFRLDDPDEPAAH